MSLEQRLKKLEQRAAVRPRDVAPRAAVYLPDNGRGSPPGRYPSPDGRGVLVICDPKKEPVR